MGAQPSRRSSAEILVIVSGMVALAQATNGFTVPAMPKMVQLLGGGTLAVGLTVSIYSVSRMFANIPSGLLVERIGRRKTLICGAGITALSASLSGVAPNIPVLLILRLATGAGAAMTITAGFVAITDISLSSHRARSLGVVQGWQFFAGVGGPALGGFLAEYSGIRAPFLASGLGVGLLAAYAYWRLPETKGWGEVELVRESRSAWAGVRELASNANYLLICLVGFTLFFTRFGLTQTLIPIFAYDELNWSPGQLGLLFSLGAILNGAIIFPSAFLADRYGRKVTIVPSGFLTIVGLVMLAFSAQSEVFIPAYLVMIVATSFGSSAPVAYLGDIVPSTSRGLATGMYRTVGDAAGVIGPVLTTSLAYQWSFGAGFLVSAVIALVSYSLFGFFASEPGRSRSPNPSEDPRV